MIKHWGQKAYNTLIRSGSCSTRGWERRIEWGNSRFQKLASSTRERRDAIARLLAAHERSMPSSLRAGRELVTELDDESLFPENIFLITSCGSNPSWESARAGRCQLRTLIAYPSSF